MDRAEFAKLASAATEAGKPIILMFEDIDGNWRGGISRKIDASDHKDVRAVGPETVLQMLLTHK